MTNQFDLGNCLALAYLSEYASSDDRIKDSYDIYALPPIKAYTEHDENVFIKRISHIKPYLVGFSCYLWNYKLTISLCDKIKKHFPDIKILLGGPEVSDPGNVLCKNNCIDMVIVGEGESSFRSLLLELSSSQPDLMEVTGLSFRYGNKIHINEKQVSYLSADEIPHIFNHRFLNTIKGEIYYETSRGCPNKCKYCSTCRSPTRLFPLDRIEDDLSLIMSSKNINHINFVDSALDIDENRFVKILEILEKHNKRHITSGGFVNLSHFNDDLLHLMLRAGFCEITIGLETLSETSLANIGRKKLKIKKLVDYLSLAENPWARAFFTTMYLIPGEEYEDFKRTLQICMNSGLKNIHSNRMLILPGTYYYQHAKEENLFFDSDPPHLLRSCNSFTENDLNNAHQLVVNLKLLLHFIKSPDAAFLQQQGIDLIDIAERIHIIYPEWNKYYSSASDLDIEVNNISSHVHEMILKFYSRFIANADALRFASQLLIMRVELYRFQITSPAPRRTYRLHPLKHDRRLLLRPFLLFLFPYSLNDFLLLPTKIPPTVDPTEYPTVFSWFPSGKEVHPFQPGPVALLRHMTSHINNNLTINDILNDPATQTFGSEEVCLKYLNLLYEHGLFDFNIS